MAQKYTDPLYDALDADVTAKLGLPSGLLSKIRLNGERSNADQVSEKGARSVYQVIPETRAALIKKYGVDPYESPQAAAMGAGYLLKESLQRNNGDVASAVGEYIGGTDRANWGKTTRAYINRVMVALNQNSGGSGGSGGGGQRLTDVYEQSKPQGAVRPDTIEQKIFESRLAGHSDADIFKKIKEKDSRYKDSKKSGFTDQQIAEKLGLSIAATPVAPKPTAPKDYTGNRMEQFTDKAGAELSNAGRVIAGDGLLDAATAIPRAGIGGVQALMTGLGGMATEAMAGLYGLGAGAVGAAQGKDFAESATQGIESARATLQPFVPQPVIAPNTANAILGAMAIPMYGTEAAGQANYDAYGNPLSAAAVQGLGDAGFAALGFRGIGKAKPTATPQPTPRPADPTPQPITEPVGTPAPVSPAARAANSPDAIRDFVRSQREPLATNPAEVMPRPDVARPAINPKNVAPRDPENPHFLQPLEAIPETDLAANGFAPKPTKTTSRKYAAPIENGERRVIYSKDGELISDQNITTYEKKTVDGDMVTVKISRDNKTGKISGIQLADAEGVYLNLDDGSRLSDEAWFKDSSFDEAPVKIEFTEKTPDGVASQLESLTDVQAYDALSSPGLLERTSSSQSIGFVPAAQAAQAIIPVITKAIRGGKTREQVVLLAELSLDSRYRFTDAGRAAIGEMVDAAYSGNAKPTPRAKPSAPKTTQGKAFTTDNTPVDFVYDVVPIEAIQKSINADLTPNAAARPDLQPRNRDTDASAAQINEISNKLNPDRLLEAPTFDTGAPTIFGAEAVAGHGRLTAIERRYLSGRGADYKAAVTAKARELGIDPAKFEGIENPVLVRRLSDDATAVKVASDSNADTTLKMSVAEQARTDAKSLPDASKLVIGEDGAVNIAGSTDFVREFMRSLPTAARGDLMRPDGTLSQAGVRRIQAAIAQKAYNDATMIERINESLDDQGKRISDALVRNAGALVALADDVKAGARVENTLAPDLAMAANKYSDIKASGSTVAEYMAQGRLVDDGMTAGALEALQVFGDNARSGKAVSDYIQGKIKEIEDQGNPSQNTLFQTTKEQKEADAVRRQYEGTPQWMKAPDGTPTKLTEQQWVQVRTPSFKQWFGDWENNPKGASKVVDENGEPLVVYHGSPFGEFNAFTESGLKNVSPKDAKGHYFTSDYGVAQAYGSGQYGGSMRGAQATVYASYLKINNPEYILDNNHRHWYIKQDKKDSLASDGKDGVIYRDSKDTMNDEYIAFDPTQIKSATGNSGAFDGANPNIYMQGNKSASQVIADTIAKQVLDTGKYDADYAQAAGELAAAYYKATAAAIGKTSKEVFDAVGLDVTAGEVKSGANAQISVGDKRHSMVLGDKANASSFVHELGHHFLETHAKLADQSPVLKADLDTIMEWGGHKGREYGDLKAAQKTELQEKFAETFEQYLLTGKAPTPKLKAAFERFKDWMTSVYESLIDFGETNPRAKLSPDITNVLDNMLGNKADARANSAREAKKSEKADAELLDFKRSAPADGGVSPRQQQSRYNVLRAIGLTVGQIRGGAVTGDSRRMGWDSLLAKSDTEAGRKMKQQMELESDKLREYGDAIVEATGGTVGAAPEVRGAAILKPLEAYRDWYKGKIREYYAAADQRAQMTGGIELVDFQKKLRENSFFDTERMGYVRKGIASWMREQDLVGADGYFRPMSAKQAESLRQYINKTHYHYEISGGIRVLNDLIDNAVFRVLGENMYAEARATNAAYHRIFTDPKGMAALLEADGINRKTSVEKVGARLGALAETDVVQFEQIVRQLENMPTKALQADANRAIGEIRAQIAEKLTAFDSTKPDSLAGTARAYAPFRGEKLDAIFGKDTAAKLRNYVAARGVLRRVDPNPSGTASAMQNLKMRGAEVAATGVGTAAGGAMGGLTGATIGGVLGQQLGRKLQNRIIEAADQRSFDKAMSPKQFETMRQTMRARADKLERSQPVQDAIKGGDKLSDKAKKVLNARILRSAEWKAYFDNLSDADKAKIKQVGALAWLSSLGADQE